MACSASAPPNFLRWDDLLAARQMLVLQKETQHDAFS